MTEEESRKMMQDNFRMQLEGLGYGPDGMAKPEKLTLDGYQMQAMRTSNKELSPDAHLMNGLLGLAGETGECCDLAKKCFYQDGRDIRDNLKDELGDVLWYVAEAATAMGWTLEEIARHNVEKLKRRYPQGFEADRSLHREE